MLDGDQPDPDSERSTRRKRRRLIYDVGLHLGEDTEFYLKKGFRVVAFEADPDLAATCRQTFATAIEAGELVIVEGAIVADPGVGHVSFWKNDDVTVWGTSSSERAAEILEKGYPGREIRVATVDLCATLQAHGIPYYMKIDIEGSGDACFDCLAQFPERPAYLSFEMDMATLDRIAAQIDAAAALGYDRFQAVQQALIHHVRLPLSGGEEPYVDHSFRRGSSGAFGRDLDNRWLDRDGIIAAYRSIVARNARFGPNTIWKRWPLKPIKNGIEWTLGTKIPGWYDTHARHAGAL